MGSRKRICCSSVLLSLVIGTATVALPQVQPASTDADIKAEERKLYEGARPYFDNPPAELKQFVPELRGLEPASSQDQLPTILAGVGANIKELLRQVPNLVSQETVTERPLGVTHPSVGGTVPEVHTFNYIVLVHETEGERMLEEYRTDLKGRPVAPSSGGPNGIGFVSLWVAFSPESRDLSQFRYLGEQQIGGYKTFVVAFAQTPGAESHPGRISLPQGGTIPVLCQGVAWIDESDFSILRLRTDLLAPQPQVSLNQLTAIIQFGPVRIANLETQLWLPRELKLDIEANGHAFQELHQYSQYRLYKAKSKIVTDLLIGTATAPLPQAQPASTDADIKAEEMKLYAGARPYLDDPPVELKKSISSLRRLEATSRQDSNEDQLSTILAGVGANIKALLAHVPDLISNETEGEELAARDNSITFHSDASTRYSVTHKVQKFNYIVLAHETEGTRMLEEYRADRKGKPVGQGPGTLSSIGFVSLWVTFSPANETKSRFRYLGEQKIGGQNTFVVAFAQTPGMQSHPGEISLPQGGTIPMLCQGVAWINKSDFRILRLRTDLLAPQPQVGLKQLTAMIQFASVRIARIEAQLWLPREVKLDVDANGQVLQDLHQYSQYRLYKAKAKIVTGAP